jgi:hypothetical protein
MKKLFFTLLILISFNTFSQTTIDSAFVYYWQDELEGDKYFSPNYDMIVANKEKTKGAKISAHINQKGQLSFITAKLIGLGNCVENNEMIILFENEEKISLKSWNDFNCKGNAYFYVTKTQLELLRNQPMKTIRVRNGSNYESVTSSEFGNPSYYMDIIHCIDNQSFKYLEE